MAAFALNRFLLTVKPRSAFLVAWRTLFKVHMCTGPKCAAQCAADARQADLPGLNKEDIKARCYALHE